MNQWWTFEITTGRMYTPTLQLKGTGYAGGNLGRNPEGKDNPADENLVDIGPLPEGYYRYGDLVLQHPKLGKYCWPLYPADRATKDLLKQYNRGGFWEHGDTTPPGNASEGCIVQGFLVRQAQWLDSYHMVQVVATIGFTPAGWDV